MGNDVLLSKVSATPGENTWSQAYSTLNLYIVLSIKDEASQGGMAAKGKDLFERIQREYFSLDVKDLKSIKQSVENAVAEVENKDNISVVLATITKGILYIIIASSGSVVLKRGEKLGVIAHEESGEIAAFSGEIRNDDVIILETSDFSKKIPTSKLSTLLEKSDVPEISESITPLLHEEALGTEAAIILQYKDLNQEPETLPYTARPTGDEQEDEAQDVQTQDEKENEESQKVIGLPKINTPKIGLKSIFSNFSKTKLIIIVIIVLAIILASSVFMEQTKKASSERQAILNEILTPAQEKFDEADALIDLNKGLALDEFNSLKSNLEKDREKLAKGTDERKKLDEFIGRVEQRIGELSDGTSLTNQKIIFDKEVALVQFKDGKLYATSSDGTVYILSPDGKEEDSFSTDNENVSAISSNDSSVFVAGDKGITKSTKSNGSTSDAVDDASGIVSLDSFGSNLYGLNRKDKTVDKYSGSSFTRGDYFSEDVTLKDPVSMAIDGSIWILDDGKVRKFTRGAEDTFSVSGLTKDFSENSQIFTSTDFDNVYVFDKDTGRIVAISKDGTVGEQYASSELANATSFTVDESDGKIYAVVANKIYSFDL